MHLRKLTKRKEKKALRQLRKILRLILNKSWRQYPPKQQLYRPSRKLSKLDEPDLRDTAEEVEKNT